MSILDLIIGKKQKQVGQRSVEVKKINNTYIFQGSQALQMQSSIVTEISTAFGNLLSFRRTDSSLTSKDSINNYKYLVDYHPFGKKASTIYKSFCANDIEFKNLNNESKEKEYKEFLSAIAPHQIGIGGTFSLQLYGLIVKRDLVKVEINY